MLRRTVLIVMLCALPAFADDHPRSELLGVWKGTSTCTDRVAAPACKDEVVVYTLTEGAEPGTVHWQADKIVNGERLNMGEFDLVYDRDDACWRAEFQNPKVHVVWCVTPNGDQLTGSAWMMPGRKVVRRIEARRE